MYLSEEKDEQLGGNHGSLALDTSILSLSLEKLQFLKLLMNVMAGLLPVVQNRTTNTGGAPLLPPCQASLVSSGVFIHSVIAKCCLQKSCTQNPSSQLLLLDGSCLMPIEGIVWHAVVT